jgi:hypothetical protein
MGFLRMLEIRLIVISCVCNMAALVVRIMAPIADRKCVMNGLCEGAAVHVVGTCLKDISPATSRRAGAERRKC